MTRNIKNRNMKLIHERHKLTPGEVENGNRPLKHCLLVLTHSMKIIIANYLDCICFLDNEKLGF